MRGLLAAVLGLAVSTPVVGENVAERAHKLAAAGDQAGAIALLEPLRDAAEPSPALGLLAQLYLEAGRPGDAYAVLSALARRDDADAGLLHDAGRLAAALGKGDESLAWLRRAVSIDAASPAQRFLGMVLLGRGEHLGAYVELRDWVRTHPQDRDARLAAAFCAVRLERLPEAEELLTGIAAHLPRARMLWGEIRLGQADYGAAVEVLEPLLEAPGSSLERSLRRLLARAYLGAHQPGKVVDVLTGHTAASSDLARLLAEAHYKTGDLEAAIAVLRPHASASDGQGASENPVVLEDLGRYLVLAGQAEEAVEVLRRVLAGRPEQAASWQFLSRALFALGRREEATAAVQQAARRQASPADEQQAYHWRVRHPMESRLGEALELHAGGDTRGALEMVHHEARLNPDRPEPRLVESIFLLRLDRPAEALVAAQEGVRLGSELGDAYYRRGNVRLAMDELSAAQSDFEHCLELDPDHLGAGNQLAVALARQGRLDAARQLLEQILVRHPDNAVARENLERLRR